MEALEKNVTEIFCQLINKMDGKEHLRIENFPFESLSIEYLGTTVQTPLGTGKLYSLCHDYFLDGNLFKDTEMGFIVIEADPMNISITPYFYERTGISPLHQLSIVIKNGAIETVHTKLNQRHIVRATSWLKMIKLLKFLDQ